MVLVMVVVYYGILGIALALAAGPIKGERAHGISELVKGYAAERAMSGSLLVLVVIIVISAPGASAVIVGHC